ncbi:MAG: hypothetical protein SVX38_06635, partial [Chloroflexota bacterium]|nr:hypothetical protein [Chloroflexota bacterium]
MISDPVLLRCAFIRGVRWLHRTTTWTVVFLLIFAAMPASPPAGVQSTPQADPEPLLALKLGITGLTTPLTTVLGVPSVQAQGSVTLTLSKRDSGAQALTPPPGPDPVAAGEQFTYHILITNTGTTTATVWVTETLPLNTTYVACDVVAGQDGGADWGRFNQGNEVYFYTMDHLSSEFDGLPASGAAILYVTVSTSEPLTDGLVITNTTSAYRANATQSPGITFYGSNDVTTTIQAPVLSINKTATPDPVVAGQLLTYTLAVSNTGHVTLTAPYTITVVDHLPANTTFAEATPSATHQNGVVTWTLPYTSDLAVDQAVTMTLAVTVTEPLTNGLALVNEDYTVSSPQVVPDSAGSPLTVTVRSWPTLQISKLTSSDPISAGEWLTYTLVVTNASDAIGPAQDLVITDVVPLNTTLIETSLAATVSGTQMISDGLEAGDYVTWTLPASFALAVGASTQVSFTVLVHSPLDGGTPITNTYGVTASNALASVSGQQVTTVSSAPDVRVSKAVQPDSVMAGRVVTYSVYLTNPGNATANDVWVTDTLPISVTYGGFISGPKQPYTTTPLIAWDGLVVTGTVTRTTGVTLTEVALVFTATVDSAATAGTYTNVVTATYDSSLIATTTPLLVANPDLRLSKTPHATTVTAGQPITYTLNYTNTSSTAASGVAITDTLPLNISSGWSDTAYAGTIAAGETITWSVGTLGGGVSDEIVLVVNTAVPLASGTVLTDVAGIFCTDGPFGETIAPVTVHWSP